MQDLLTVTGIVLKVEPIGEYDRRVVILTTDRGKISCFAKGARKQGNRLMAATNPFCFGDFKLYVGRSSYSLNDVEVKNYFEFFRLNFEEACYGMYFLEVIDYYTRENNDEKEMLKLLYQSLRALENGSLNNRLIRYIFEIKSIVINGEFPGLPSSELGKELNESTVYTVNYIVQSTIEKLYTFSVTDEVLLQLQKLSEMYMKNSTDKLFKSLEMLIQFTD